MKHIDRAEGSPGCQAAAGLIRSIAAVLEAALVVAAAGAAPIASAAPIVIEMDPGMPGDNFASRAVEIPELIGLPLSTEEVQLRFLFADAKFVMSTLYGQFSALRAVSLELTVTPGLPNQGVPGDGFLLNEQGFALEPSVTSSDGGFVAATGDYRLSLHVPRPVRLAPSPAIVESDPYFGMFMRFEFLAVPAGSGAEILSARIEFEDERARFPIAADPQHTVGQLVPAPPAIWLLGSALVALLGRRQSAA